MDQKATQPAQESFFQNSYRPRIAVLGGGIAGLASAFWLTEFLPEAAITLYEVQARLGGLIGTKREDGCLLEMGPLDFPSGTTSTGEMLRLAGLGPMLRASTHSGSMGIWNGHKLLPFPSSPWAFLRSRLLSPLGLLRLMLEPFIPARKNATEETVESFFRRRTGEEFLRRFLEPAVPGFHAGDCASMSMSANLPEFVDMEKRSGSLALGYAKKIFSNRFKNKESKVTTKEGSQGIIDALVHELKRRGVRLLPSHAILHIIPENRYRITFEAPHGDGQELFDSVIGCIPSYRLTPIINSWPEIFKDFLSGIPHAPLVVAYVAANKTDLAGCFQGEGCLVQSSAEDGVLSFFRTSRLAPNRCSPDQELIRVMLGGAKSKNRVFFSPASVQRVAENIIRKILKTRGELKVFPCIRHSRALPQLRVGHVKEMENLRAWLKTELPGFYLAGSSFDGAGIERAVNSGKQAASEAACYLAGNGNPNRTASSKSGHERL